MSHPGVVHADLSLWGLWVEDVDSWEEVRDAVMEALDAGLGSIDWFEDEDLTAEAIKNEMAEREFEIRKDER